MARAGHAVSVVLLCFCAMAALPAWAAAPDYEGKNIASIVFIPREQPVDPEELYRILPVKIKTPLHLDNVRAAINRLYATGAYADIQVDAEMLNGDVILRFITENSWFVGRVGIDGDVKEPPNPGQLINASRLDLGEPFSDEKMKQALNGIGETFENNGYYQAKVQPRFRYDPRTNQAHIDFVVDSGKRAHYAPPAVTGDPKLPAKEVVRATGWKGWLGWKGVREDRTQKGLERVRQKYQRRNRLRATVTVDDTSYDAEHNTVTVTLNVQAGPTVEVRTIGFKVSPSKLKRYVPIYEERTVDLDLLMEGARNLKDLLQSQGYFEAEVEFKQQRVVNDKAVIDYLVNPGKPHKLVQVNIDGNHYFDTATIRERMYLTPGSFQLRRGRYGESYRRRDEESIANLYRENGFRDVKVTSTTEDDYKGVIGHIAVTMHIEEGAQWFVSALTLDGAEQIDKGSVTGMLSSTAGQPYSEFNVAVDRDAILTRYFSEGFPNATFEWNAKPGAKPHQMELHYLIREGERRFVRQVLIGGLETTQDRLINRNISLNPGDPVSQTKMVDTQRRLYDLGIFARVDMAIQNPEGDTQYKYVLYQMEEAKKYSISTGFGAEIARIGGSQTSLEAPGGKAGFSPRVSFDASRLNFRGLGHTVSFRSRVSNLDRRALISYLAPRVRNIQGLNLSFTVLYDDSRDVRTFSAKREEGSVQLSQKLSKSNTLLYRFSYRRVSVSDVKIVSALLLPLLSQPVRIGMPSINFIQDRRDDPTDSHKGIYNTIDLGITARQFASQASFTRFLGRNSTYHPVGKKLVIARSLQFGWLYPYAPLGSASGPSQPDDVPLAERFFSGGANSHRGFPEFQAGPRDEQTGFPLGGRALLIHNTELRFPLIGDNIGGVLFHDAGNVYSSLRHLSLRYQQRDLKDFDYMVHAFGFGIRYRTPIGPVRADLAFAPNSPRFVGCSAPQKDQLFSCGPPTEQRINRLQFHFSIGQTF